MATTAIRVGNEAANDVVTTWVNEFKLNPTEDMLVADFVDKLPVDGKFGQTIKVRFIPYLGYANMTTVSNAASQNTLSRPDLTWINNTDTVVTGTSSMVYGAIRVNRNVWNQVRDDSDYRAKQKKALSLGMGEKVDFDVFNGVSGFSQTITQADLDDAALRSGVGILRRTAKNKAKLGEADIRLYLHPNEVANAMGINAIKEYQIRGNAGAAATGSPVNTYGIKWDATGLVYQTGGAAYCPLMLKDALYIAYNETPHPLADQVDGLTDVFIVVGEYATGKEFDSSGVAFVLTV